ncbi:[FeFe] hydrogenase H-cluster maturation GTPase HydF [Odoribacter sp. OttesenSCG-928-J03]|nr:[FeFe] hydrogenase H-cluster maturation GTPase HydF [Odoribacter sp. OttesenSCG-928-J03]MDL2283417.1 [FeFe] hydrogenase H-cluster maturation GTPase HydF [Odoribacter sp. OttesenSCG-928-G04]
MQKRYISLIGRRNVGKSSIINMLTGQNTAIVSDTPGTTTDPVKKSYEIPGFASVVFTDTAGIDDEGELGLQRIEKTRQAIMQSDLALLVITENRFGKEEEELCDYMKAGELPFIIVHNKSDIQPLSAELKAQWERKYHTRVLDVSTLVNPDASVIIEAIKLLPLKTVRSTLIGDLMNPGDFILLVTPIDSEAPTGRLILPQVQTTRDILDNHGIVLTMQPEEITGFLNKTGVNPQLVITDSQVFKEVADNIPANTPLTSFSIILARQKGNFKKYVEGTRYIDQLKDGDSVLILESCSHHVSCEDIGRHKLPKLLSKYTGKHLNFDFIAGLDSIDTSVPYAMVIQCGGCMITERQLKNRITPFIQAGVPVSNYGMAIAYANGIFERSIRVFEEKISEDL